jgi:hypothetical protein
MTEAERQATAAQVYQRLTETPRQQAVRRAKAIWGDPNGDMDEWTKLASEAVALGATSEDWKANGLS